MWKQARTIGAVFMGTTAGIFLMKPEPAVAGMYAISALVWAFTLWVESDRAEHIAELEERFEERINKLQTRVDGLSMAKGMMR